MGDDAQAKAQKMTCYKSARAIAETLIALDDQYADGHVWWAVAHGRIGQTQGVMNSLFMVPALKRELNRALELDSSNTTAYDVLGVMYYELPGIAGGDLGKSEDYLLKGINLDPNYTLLRLDLAKVYTRQKEWAKAREQLDALLATDNPTYPADTELDDKRDARDLLKTIPEE